MGGPVAEGSSRAERNRYAKVRAMQHAPRHRPHAARTGRRALAAAALTLALCATSIVTAPIASAAVDTDVFKGGLDWPTAFTFDATGRVFYVERFSGRVRILAADASTDQTLFKIGRLVGDGEDGLLGIALHPAYPTKPYVYVYATRRIDGKVRNQIVRITDDGGTGRNLRVIFTSKTEAGAYHDGGRILFGPDDKLYAIVGDAHNSNNAQRLGTTAGKIVRMNPNGGVPDDNPFDGKRIFAYGIRNSFGFAFDPETDRLWESENGPGCNDEMNLVPEGANMAWGPSETCGHPPATPDNTNQDGTGRHLPKAWWVSTIAPTGTAFCDSCGLSSEDGNLLMGDWNDGNIRAFTLNGPRDDLTDEQVIYNHSQGILSMEVSPTGAIFFSDPNGISELVDTP